MIRLMILLVVLSISSFVRADVLGRWQGNGTFTDVYGRHYDCQSMTLTLETKDNMLTFRQETVCGQESFDPVIGLFEIKGSDLYLGGQKIGNMTDTAVSFAGYNLGTGLVFSAEMNLKDGGTMTYRDRVDYVDSPGYFDSLEGSLQKY